MDNGITRSHRHTPTSVLLEPAPSADALLQAMLVDFRVISRADLTGVPDAARAGLTATLRSFLESLESLPAHAVVIVDAAQALPADVLDEIHAMARATCLSGGCESSPLVNLIPPGLLKRAGLSDCVVVRCELEPLAADEISGYIRHRIAVAGSSPRVEFDEDACARICECRAASRRS